MLRHDLTNTHAPPSLLPLAPIRRLCETAETLLDHCSFRCSSCYSLPPRPLFCVLALLLWSPSPLLHRIAPSRASGRPPLVRPLPSPSFPCSRHGRRQQQTEQMSGGRTRQLGKEYHHQPSEARHEEGENWKGGRGGSAARHSVRFRCSRSPCPAVLLLLLFSAPLRSLSRLPRWLRRSAFWLRSSNTAT